jgi:predicted aconitase with swiveling domain
MREVAGVSDVYHVRRIVRGRAEAEAVVCPGSFSFLGDVDLDRGLIIARTNPNRGLSIAGRVLIYEETKGSSGGCVVLLTLARRQLAPAALVTVQPADYNLAEGAILAGVPFICEPDRDVIRGIATGQLVRVDAGAELLEAL